MAKLKVHSELLEKAAGRLLFWPYFLILVGYLVLDLLPGNESSLFYWVGEALPWLLILPLLLLPLALWRHWYAAMAFAGVCGVLFGVFYAPLLLPPSPVSELAPRLKVMSYNIHLNTRVPAPLIEVVRAYQPEVLAMQELYPDRMTAVAEALSAEYPYWEIGQGYGLYSRFPLQNCWQWRNGMQLNGWGMGCQIIVDGQSITIIDVHLHPVNGMQGLLANRQDMQMLLDELADVTGPMIVMGDFNFTSQSDGYDVIRNRLADAFWERGWGMGFTLSRRPEWGFALLRFDYVFHSPELIALDAQTGDFGSSDHRPVIVRFGWLEP